MQWGLKHKLCDVHYQQIVGRLTDNGVHQIEASYLSDYVGLKAMMLEMQTVMLHMHALSAEISNAITEHQMTPDDVDDRFRADRAEDIHYIRISRVLENYEGYCWFPPCHRIFVAGLSAADFYWYLEHGYMVKDPGPNIMHGDFTHRYQWHAIMRHLTGNFSSAAPRDGWNHSALQLYVSLGKSPAKEANIWGKVLDRDDASAPDIVPYQTFSNPNTLHRALRESKLYQLTENTTRRFLKRESARQQANHHIERWKTKHQAKWTEWKLANTEPLDSDIAGLIYAWRKNGGQPIGVSKTVPDLAPKRSDESSVDFSNRQKDWRAQKRLANAATVVESRLKHKLTNDTNPNFAYKHNQPHYEFIITPQSDAGFAVLAEVFPDDSIQHVSGLEIGQRVGASAGGFDAGHYTYGKTGAKKTALASTLPTM